MANGKKPIKLLPPYRTAILKQFEILRAFGIATGAEPRTVTNAEVARLVDLKPDTVSLGNTFFASIGLLTKAEGGHIPAEVLIQYARANEWDPEKSFRQASRIIQDSWFAQELLPKLRMRPMSRDEIIGLLANRPLPTRQGSRHSIVRLETKDEPPGGVDRKRRTSNQIGKEGSPKAVERRGWTPLKKGKAKK